MYNFLLKMDRHVMSNHLIQRINIQCTAVSNLHNINFDPKRFHGLTVVGLMISSFICLSKCPTCEEGLFFTLQFFVFRLHTTFYACGGNLRGATCSSEAVNLHTSAPTLPNFNRHSYINLNAFHVKGFTSYRRWVLNAFHHCTKARKKKKTPKNTSKS